MDIHLKTPLRVGVLSGLGSPTDGGAWSLNSTLVEALRRAQSVHDFIFLDGALTPVTKKTRLSRAVGGVSDRIRSRVDRSLGRSRPDSDGLARLEAIIRQQKIDLVWFMTQSAGLPLSIPFIATVWDLEHRKQPYFPEVSTTGWTWAEREMTYRSVLPRASYVIAGTKVGKEEIVHYYQVNPDHVKIVPFPVPRIDTPESPCDFQVMRTKYNIDGDFIFYPAQFWPSKNHVNLLLALDILRKRDGLKISLVLSGSDKGNRDYVREKVREFGLSDQVFDLGFVSRDALNALYRNALALVYPNFCGPDNLPPLEAFALECPVAAADVAGVGEELGLGALLFDPTDPIDMADKILAVSSDESLRARLVREGRKIAVSRTPENYIDQVIELLDVFGAIRRCWGRNYQHT